MVKKKDLAELQKQILELYPTVGYQNNGTVVPKDLFKKLLIARGLGAVDHIGQAVNALFKEGRLPIPQTQTPKRPPAGSNMPPAHKSMNSEALRIRAQLPGAAFKQLFDKWGVDNGNFVGWLRFESRAISSLSGLENRPMREQVRDTLSRLVAASVQTPSHNSAPGRQPPAGPTGSFAPRTGPGHVASSLPSSRHAPNLAGVNNKNTNSSAQASRSGTSLSSLPEPVANMQHGERFEEFLKYRDGGEKIPSNSGSDHPRVATEAVIPPLDEQFSLLGVAAEDVSYETEIEKAVMVSASIFDSTKFETKKLLPQVALIGSGHPLEESDAVEMKDRRIFLNTNHPASYFICGLQGSGKSHTTSCILENHLLKSPILGSLISPCSALVFHYGQFSTRSIFRPAEAAYLAHPAKNLPKDSPAAFPVTVLVSPSNFLGLNAAYSEIPGIRVARLKLPARSLGVSALLGLMSFDTSHQPPLYMGSVTKVLRDMAEASVGDLNYLEFRQRLERINLQPLQRGPLEQRLNLLESFLDLDGSGSSFNFSPGSLTIVDLSCPFVDESTACVLFNTVLGVYLESNQSRNKIIAVDEAHKYMTNTPASKILTEQLLGIIRQQRHYGARVIISTQEPTISPRLMDLSSATIIHRFSSPDWFEVLRKHIPETTGLFDKIVDLRVGEALVFASSAFVDLGLFDPANDDPWQTTANRQARIEKLSGTCMRVNVRRRITWDGGKSVVCV